MQAAWENDYYDQAIGFFRNFLSSALKTNPSLEFAVLTGVLRIARESSFHQGVSDSHAAKAAVPCLSALNNLDVSSVVSGSYADIVGFTPEEVGRMAEDLGHADKLDEIRDWYDGYDFSGHEIYNPWSVINYFDRDCEAEPYWVNTSGNGILADMLSGVDAQRESELRELLDGRTVSTALRDTAIYHEIYKSRDALYTMLMTTGYLKCVRRHKVQDEEWADLAIPNREVRLVFRREIMEHLASGLGTSTLRLMLDAMKAGNATAFESHLQRILRESVSVHDTAYPETFYHGMMLGFSVLLADQYEIESNRESGYGRFDLAFVPRDKGQAGIIMEFKKAAGEDALEAAARAALEQIGEKHYVTALTKRGIGKIWKYGIAFAGKRLKLLCG